MKRMNRTHIDPKLVHGVFNTQSDALAAFNARCAQKGINPSKFTWVGPKQAPDFDPNDPETVVVLDATFGSVPETFRFAWDWMVDAIGDRWQCDLMPDADNIVQLDSIKFAPWTIAWRHIKLDAHIGAKPADVRNRNSPGCSLLFMAAEHPGLIDAIDDRHRWGFWLAGLEWMARTRESVPLLILDGRARKMMAPFCSPTLERTWLVVPEFLT